MRPVIIVETFSNGVDESVPVLLGPYVPSNEPRREKTGFLHMRKQRRRSASR